ncbi:unnamed protein product, partial [Strongylus vulgaris]
IKLPYYQDCGSPGLARGENVTTAWKRCSDDYDCSTQCVNAYMNRYKGECALIGEEECQIMSRLHNGGPSGCKNPATVGYWQAIQECCGCT